MWTFQKRTDEQRCGNAVQRSGFTLIELLVVMGIAALLMTLAATSFFGASRRDNITKSRDQFCDVLRLARQQASILGKTHVVVCWNADTKITVGNQQISGGKQGRYAMFEYVGNVWPSEGAVLTAPFGLQREAFSVLTKNARLINIKSPEDGFMRVDKLANDATLTDEESEEFAESEAKVDYDYLVHGEERKFNFPSSAVVKLRTPSKTKSAFPLGIRVSQTFALPKDYCFSQERTVFVFTPEGKVEAKPTASVEAKHSVSKNADNATFTVSISSEGKIEKK